jgi:hypothetical protein
MPKNTFFDAILYLKESLDRFRHERGYLIDPEGSAASEIVSLETEAIISMYLGHPNDIHERLEHAYKQALACRLIDTEQVIAAYTQRLPFLKVPLTNRIWAEDDCCYNLGLEAHLKERDYVTMIVLLVHEQMDKLTHQVQGLREPMAIS